MEMIQQLQQVLHKRTMKALVNEAKTLVSVMRDNDIMDSEVRELVQKKYRGLGIVVNCIYGNAYEAVDLKVNTEHPYYKKTMDLVTLDFENQLDHYNNVTRHLESEESAS